MTLTLKDNEVIYEHDPQNGWSMELEEIKFIGEYTTEAGPVGSDWFFVFAEGIDQWWQVPALAINHERFWKELGEKLNTPLTPQLFASTTWATRVMYPPSVEGQELFVIVPAGEKPATVWQKLFGSMDEEHLELTEPVKQLFG